MCEVKEKFPIEPLFDRVFVKKDEVEKDEESGFYLPDSVKNRAHTGLVVAAGPGYLDTTTGDFHPMQLKVGDKIFMKEFDGYIVNYGGHKFFVFSEKEILGRIVTDD